MLNLRRIVTLALGVGTALMAGLAIALIWTLNALASDPSANPTALHNGLLAAEVDVGILSVALLGIMTLVAWVSVEVIRAPMRELSDRLERIGAGDFEERAPAAGLAEIEQLGASANRMARSLSERELKLIHSERNATTLSLARVFAHEVNNPLTFMRVNQAMLRSALDARLTDSRLSLEERAFLTEAEKHVDITLRGIHRLAEVTSAMRTAGRRDRVHPALSLDLNDVVRQAVLLCRARINAGIGLTMVLAPELKVQGEGAALSEIVVNLILNAADSIRDAGSIDVVTEVLGNDAVLHVTDDGPGISPAQAKHVFQPYWSTKSNAMGLGLWSSRRIAQEHGGQLSYWSQPGKRTRFTLRLPLFPAPSARSEPDAATSDMASDARLAAMAPPVPTPVTPAAPKG
ncbi:MAG: sensor histidine kinase [Thermoplasmatota archaeon]